MALALFLSRSRTPLRSDYFLTRLKNPTPRSQRSIRTVGLCWPISSYIYMGDGDRIISAIVMMRYRGPVDTYSRFFVFPFGSVSRIRRRLGSPSKKSQKWRPPKIHAYHVPPLGERTSGGLWREKNTRRSLRQRRPTKAPFRHSPSTVLLPPIELLLLSVISCGHLAPPSRAFVPTLSAGDCLGGEFT